MTARAPFPGYDPNDPEHLELADMMRREDARRWQEAADLHRQEQYEREAQAAREAEEAARVAAIQERRKAQAAWELPFVETSAAAVVFSTIQRCLHFGHNGLVIGAPGVGKTRALREAVRRSDALQGPSVGLVTVTSVMGASTMAVFEEVAPHLGVKPAFSISATLKRLCREACFAPVMLFDEAQNLSLRSARELLAISEEARIQMVFLGNDEVLKLVNSKQAAIQQIARRLPVREEIGCILDTDADLIANRFDVDGMDAYRLCRQLAGAFHADGLAKLLPIARHTAHSSGSPTVNVTHIREALAMFPHFAAGLKAAAAMAALPSPALTGRKKSKR